MDDLLLEDEMLREAGREWRSSETPPAASGLVSRALGIARSRRRRRAALGVAGTTAAVALIAALAAGIGVHRPDQSVAAPNLPAVVEIGQVVRAAGFIFQDGNGPVYLCAEASNSATLGSRTMCLGARLNLQGIDLGTLDNLRASQNHRWSDDTYQVTGTVQDDSTVIAREAVKMVPARPSTSIAAVAPPCVESSPGGPGEPDVTGISEEMERDPSAYSGFWIVGAEQAPTAVVGVSPSGMPRIAEIRDRVAALYAGPVCLVRATTSANQRASIAADLRSEHPAWSLSDSPMDGGLVVSLPVYTEAIASELNGLPGIAQVRALAE